MSQGYAYSKAGVSGQRTGVERRQRDLGPPEGMERRRGEDRRGHWTPLNEWTSTLKRQDAGTGEEPTG